MPLEAIIVTTLFVIGMLAVFGIEIWVSLRKRPTYWIQTPTRRFGVRWYTNDRVWPGFERAVRAIEHVLLLRYGADTVKKKKLLDFWIDVYPKNVPLRTATSPTGRTPENRVISGTLERQARFFGLSQQFIILVAQHHKTKTRMPNGEIWQEGELLSAENSALFHEVAEHYVPLKLKNDINIGHADEWKLLTLEMRQAYKLLEAAEK